jgi:hypothetical protein
VDNATAQLIRTLLNIYIYINININFIFEW